MPLPTPYPPGSLAAAIEAVANHPTPINLMTLRGIAVRAHRMESALDELVAGAMENAAPPPPQSNVVMLRRAKS